MFDIGFIEITIVSMVALIVVGPERLPHVARTIGHLLGRLRRYVSSVKIDIQNEIRLDELKKMHTSIKETTDSIEKSIQQEIDQIKSMAETDSTANSHSPTTIETNTNADSQTDEAVPSGNSQSQATDPQQQAKNNEKH